MPDIAMCPGGDCPSKLVCYRHTAEPTPFRQSYMDFNKRRHGNKCDSFMEIWSSAGSLDEEGK